MKLKYRYALKGQKTGELLSYNGRVIVHNNREELAWLMGKGIESGTLSVVEISAQFASKRPLLRLEHHPDMAAVRFPLDRDEFRDRR